MLTHVDLDIVAPVGQELQAVLLVQVAQVGWQLTHVEVPLSKYPD